ncbi:Asparaginase/glutaminase [Dactylonectria macrodidyma]|uniref:asparaginase n=1 Tax=Dactylonectria macrodidyma TaxID=307937 RepID=A0A9P9D8F8_9HYPO|nr:Asparaginase/glutaminase [Dactylonectria macrodidyma]
MIRMAMLWWCLCAILSFFTQKHLWHESLETILETRHLPNITIISTGGTIAGTANSSEITTSYRSGALNITEVIKDIRGKLENVANIHVDQFLNIDSLEINSSIAVSISHRIGREVLNPCTQGIVLLLGTDLMSEVATLLSLTIKSNKPVVLTGAIWPHKATSADGPGHIIAAVTTAATIGRSSRNHEVIIVIQEKILAPWGTKKENDRFRPGPASWIGDIRDSVPFFRRSFGHCAPLKIDVSGLDPGVPLPAVEILHAYQDFRPAFVATAIAEGAEGLVLVGYGDGYWPSSSAQQIRDLLLKTDVVTVLANAGQSEYVDKTRIGVGIPGGGWIPTQLRILLQVLLFSQVNEDEMRIILSDGPRFCEYGTGDRRNPL